MYNCVLLPKNTEHLVEHFGKEICEQAHDDLTIDKILEHPLLMSNAEHWDFMSKYAEKATQGDSKSKLKSEKFDEFLKSIATAEASIIGPKYRGFKWIKKHIKEGISGLIKLIQVLTAPSETDEFILKVEELSIGRLKKNLIELIPELLTKMYMHKL